VHTLRIKNCQSFFSPTDAQLNSLKKNFKITLKLILKSCYMFQRKTPTSGSALLELAKVTVVKIN